MLQPHGKQIDHAKCQHVGDAGTAAVTAGCPDLQHIYPISEHSLIQR